MLINGKIKLAIMMSETMFRRTFRQEDLSFLSTFADIVNPGPYPQKIDEQYMKEHLAKAEACFTCWGTPVFTKDVLESAPFLKLILHGAGTPKAFTSEEVWRRGIRVATAAPIIAIDVAESALGGIIYWLKRFGEFDSMTRQGRWSEKTELMPKIYRLNWMLTVGIVSASHVGKNLIRMLKPFGVKVLLYDPSVSPDAARRMGVSLVPLDELMSQSHVVSLHAPMLPETRGMIGRRQLSLMKDGALFVNTSRGQVVDETALIDELKSKRIFAYLDVFETEPLPENSELMSLENVLLTPHISGGQTVNGGFERGNYIINQLWSYSSTGRLEDESLSDMQGTMA
ncbi:MAG: hydroxyacid dehydrogenase [Christensenellales bacterium]